jgi:DNA-binding MarR family transcriptional regulator
MTDPFAADTPAADPSAADTPAVPLAVLRQRLVMHPATLGQILDRLTERGLVTLAVDPKDRRRRPNAYAA